MKTPTETVRLLIEAINAGDSARASEYDEPDAALVVQMGQVVRGRASIQEALGS
jgi:ketosteroid isomerase-like protein